MFVSKISEEKKGATKLPFLIKMNTIINKVCNFITLNIWRGWFWMSFQVRFALILLFLSSMIFGYFIYEKSVEKAESEKFLDEFLRRQAIKDLRK
jgi:hypothetical protein